MNFKAPWGVPTLENEEEARIALLLRPLLLIGMLFWLLIAGVMLYYHVKAGVVLAGLVVVVDVGLLTLLANGRLWLTNAIIIILLWGVVVFTYLTLHFDHTTVFIAYFLILLSSSFLISPRALLIFSFFVLGADFLINQLFNLPTVFWDKTWFYFAVQFLLATLILYLITRQLKGNRFYAQRNQQVLNQTLHQAVAALTSALDINQILDWILTLLANVLHYDSATIFLIEGEHLEVVACRGLENSEELKKQTFALDNPLVRQIRKTLQPITVSDVHKDPRFAFWGNSFYIHGWMAVPLVVRGEMIGLLTIDSQQKGSYGPTEAIIARNFAQQASIAIENARLFHKTSQQAEEIQITSDILRTLDESPDVMAAFAIVATNVKTTTLCERVSLVLFNENRETAVLVASDPPVSEQHTKHPSTAYAATAAILLGLTHSTPDLKEESHFPIEGTLYQNGYRSQICIPLKVGETPVGFLQLCWLIVKGYEEVSRNFLERISDTLTLAVERGRVQETNRRQKERASSLRKVSNLISSSLDVNDILYNLAHQTLDLLSVPACNILLFEPPDKLVWHVNIGMPPEASEVKEQRIGYTLSGWVAIHRQPLAVYEMATDERMIPEYRDFVREKGLHSFLGVPMEAKGELVGILNVHSYEPRHFQTEEIDLLMAFAGQGAIAVQNARLFEEVITQRLNLETEVVSRTADLIVINEQLAEEITERKRAEATLKQVNQRLEAMQAIDRAILSAESPEAISDVALRHLQVIFPFVKAWVFFFDFKAQLAFVLATRPSLTWLRVKGSTPLKVLTSLPTLMEKKPYIISDLKSLERPSQLEAHLLETGSTSYICFPLISQGYLIGSLNLDIESPDQLSQEAQEILQEIADTMSIVIQQAQLRRELEQYNQNLKSMVDARTAELTSANDTLLWEISERHQLEQKVQESLARRTVQVHTSVEIAQRIATAPALSELFERIVKLVKERFHYYYVQVYTLEPRSQLVLEAVMGPSGTAVLNIYRALDVHDRHSLVSFAARTGRPVRIKDLPSDTEWSPDPDLPGIQAEIAVPIKLGDEVLGVLDVHNDRVEGIDEEDELLLVGLCGQIAVAINNRRLEDKQKQSEIALKARAIELEQSNRNLQSSNQELERFATIASHDLQEPLRKIQAFGNRLQTKYVTVLDAQAHDYLDRMQKSAARMQALLNDLLTFTQVLMGGQPFVMVNLQVVAEEAVRGLGNLVEETKAQITIGELPTIEADPSQMYQLFQHLLSNSLKYRQEDLSPSIQIDGILLQDPSLPLEEQSCEIRVQDNGIGFEEKYLDRIFQVFQRLHTRTAFDGTGVGLAVCRRIVERHTGHITAHSQPNVGSVFIVTLPVKQPKIHLVE